MVLTYKKRKWLIRKSEQGIPITELCLAQNISRTAFYKLKSAYEKHGEQALIGRQCGAKKQEISENLKRRIAETRENLDAGPERIRFELGKEGIHLSTWKIYNTLNELGLNKPNPKKQRPRKYIRWQREHSNSLWQVDWMFYSKYRKWLLAYLDDHSRFVTAAGYFRQATTENALELLDIAISNYGKPREVMSDRGTQFCAQRGEASLFTIRLNEFDIKHILASVHKPTTNGKIERWFLTFRLEIHKFKSLQDFVEFYNKQRPHMSLSYKTPFEVFERDLK